MKLPYEENIRLLLSKIKIEIAAKKNLPLDDEGLISDLLVLIDPDTEISNQALKDDLWETRIMHIELSKIVFEFNKADAIQMIADRDVIDFATLERRYSDGKYRELKDQIKEQFKAKDIEGLNKLDLVLMLDSKL